MAKEPVVVALDLGGTNARLALVDTSGKILARWEWATATMPDQETLVATLAADLAVCREKAQELGAEIKGMGLGVPGRVLPREGRVAFSPNIPALNDCPLVPRLQPQCSPGPCFWKTTPTFLPWESTGWGRAWGTTRCWGSPWGPAWGAA